MRTLTDLFSAEIPLIDAAIAQELNRLPPSLQPVAAHIAVLPGKRIRPLICVALARCLGENSPSVYPLAAALEILHCATLLHDDILDEAHTRRGAPAAHLQFTAKLALLAGDAMFALAGGIVARYERPALMNIFSTAIQRTAEGQALELSNLFNPQLDWELYIQTAGGKTASLFEAAATCGAEFAGATAPEHDAAANFGFNLGLAFQIMDDLLDFLPTPDTGKPQGGDVREGKLTSPLLCWLDQCAPEERQGFLAKFSKEALPRTDLTALCRLMQSADITNKTKLRAETYTRQASNCLKALPFNQFRCSLSTFTRVLTK